MSRDAPQRHAGNTPYRLLDAWRGVAALWVVMLHIRLDTTPTFLRFWSAGGHLGVPMFFVISGYCIASAAMRAADRPAPTISFLKARIRRIYPPYFFASLLAAALSLLLTQLIHHHIVQSSQIAELNLPSQGWRFYVAALTITQVPLHTPLIIRVLWSLCYEVAFYALAALGLFLALRAKRPRVVLDGLAVLTMATLLWLNFAGNACPFPWNLWPQFGLGVLVYQILAQPERKIPKFSFLLCVALLGAYALRHGKDSFADGLSSGFQALFTLGFAVILLLLFRWDDALAKLRLVRAFSWVGLFSYSLYLIHLLALGIVTQGLNRVHFIESHALLLYFVKLVLCIVVGRLFFQFCEQPFLDTRQKQLLQRNSGTDEVN